MEGDWESGLCPSADQIICKGNPCKNGLPLEAVPTKHHETIIKLTFTIFFFCLLQQENPKGCQDLVDFK